MFFKHLISFQIRINNEERLLNTILVSCWFSSNSCFVAPPEMHHTTENKTAAQKCQKARDVVPRHSVDGVSPGLSTQVKPAGHWITLPQRPGSKNTKMDTKTLHYKLNQWH